MFLWVLPVIKWKVRILSRDYRGTAAWWVFRITVWLYHVSFLPGPLESHRGIFNPRQTKHQCVSAELRMFERLFFFFFFPLERYQLWRHRAQWPLVWPTVRWPQITQVHCKFQEIHSNVTSSARSDRAGLTPASILIPLGLDCVSILDRAEPPPPLNCKAESTIN